MKVLCLVDGRVDPPDRWIWNYLPAEAQQDIVEFLNVKPRDLFANWGKLLTYYPAYCQLAMRALLRCIRSEYDMIVAWEGKNGFPLALIRNLLRLKSPKLVILSYSHRGIITHFPRISRFALRSVDHITVTTQWEVKHYAETLGVSESRITFCPFGWYDVETMRREPVAVQEEGFILAPGRSYRDYATLAAAMDGIESKVVIVARRFNIKGVDFPSQSVVKDFLPMTQFLELQANADFVVIPLMDVSHAAGDIHIIQAMAAGKAVVATDGPSARTYIDHGITGLLVPPRDPGRLREAMKYLLEHPKVAMTMGRSARKIYEAKYTFRAFSKRTYATLEGAV